MQGRRVIALLLAVALAAPSAGSINAYAAEAEEMTATLSETEEQTVAEQQSVEADQTIVFDNDDNIASDEESKDEFLTEDSTGDETSVEIEETSVEIEETSVEIEETSVEEELDEEYKSYEADPNAKKYTYETLPVVGGASSKLLTAGDAEQAEVTGFTLSWKDHDTIDLLANAQHAVEDPDYVSKLDLSDYDLDNRTPLHFEIDIDNDDEVDTVSVLCNYGLNTYTEVAERKSAGHYEADYENPEYSVITGLTSITLKVTRKVDNTKVDLSADQTCVDQEIVEQYERILNSYDDSFRAYQGNDDNYAKYKLNYSALVSDYLDESVNAGITVTREIVNANTGGSFSQFTQLTEAGIDAASLFVEGLDDEKYFLNQDYTDPTTYTYYAKSAAKNATSYVKWSISLEPESQYTSLGEFSEVLGGATKVLTFVDDMANYKKDSDELKEYINNSNIRDKEAALKAADELYRNQVVYALMTDALIPFVVAACGPASTGAAILLSGAQVILDRWAGRFWEQRVAGILGDSYYTTAKAPASNDVSIDYDSWDSDKQHKEPHITATGWGTVRDGISLLVTGEGPFYGWYRGYEGPEAYVKELTYYNDVVNTYIPLSSRSGHPQMLESVRFSAEATEISKGTFANSVRLKTINFPEKLQTICEDAFRGSGLPSLKCNDGLTTIEKNAFRDCTNLSSITFNKNLETIGESAFQDDYNLRSLELPEGLKSIGKYAFYHCNRISGTVVIPESVTEIGEWAFAGCSSIEKLIIKGNIDTISKNAFGGCDNLKEIHIVGNVKTLADGALYTSRAEKIYLPVSLIRMGYDYSGFSQVPKEIYYEGTPEEYADLISNSRSSFDGIKKYHFNYNYETGVEGFEYSGNCGTDLKWELTGLYNNNLGKHTEFCVRITGTGAMSDYESFTDTPWSQKIEEILKSEDSSYWAGYADIRSYYLTLDTDSITKIGANAFCNASFINDLILPDTLKEIGAGAFKKAKADYIYIPDSVTTIGENAFEQAQGISSSSARMKIHLGKGITEIPKDCFSYAKLAGTIKIPDSVTSVGDGAFYYSSSSSSDERIMLPSSPETIGVQAFKGRTIYDLSPLKNTRSIGSSAFNACTVQKGELVFTDKLTSLEQSAFENCHGLTSIKFGSNLTEIGRYAFRNCTDLAGELVIPSSVQTIWSGAFDGCSSLTSLKLSDGVRVVDDEAFSGCSGLSGDLFIPYTVESIGYCAFYNCSGFNGKLDYDLDRRVNWYEPKLEASAFSGCSGLTGDVPVFRMLSQRTYWGCDGISRFIFALSGSVYCPKGEIGQVREGGNYFEADKSSLPENAKVYCDTASSSVIGERLVENGYEYTELPKAYNYHICSVEAYDLELDMENPVERMNLYSPYFLDPTGIEVIVDNPSIASIKRDDGRYTIRALKKGKTKYTVNGPNGMTATATITVTGSGSVTPEKTYSIEFVNNGHGEAVQKLTSQSEIPYDLPELSEEGYTFDGWYTAMTKDESGNPVFSENNAAIAGTSLTADTKLYAKWTANTYTVTFDAGKGKLDDGALATKTVTFGQPYGELPVAVSNEENETFIGWYTAAIEGKLIRTNSVVDTASDHRLYAVYKAIVPTGISLNYSEIKLVSGQSKQLVARVIPSDAVENVVWSSSDESIVAVDNGKVTAKTAGKAIITAKTEKTSLAATCEVTVVGSDVVNDAAVADSFAVPEGLWTTGIEDSYKYTGTKITPIFNVYYGNTLLKSGSEYTVAYKNNINAGTATITITGKGNFSGKCTKTFVITQLELSDNDVDIAPGVENAGKPVKPSVVVMHNGVQLKEKKDYTLSYEPISEAGKTKVTVTGQGNYSGEVEKDFYVRVKGTASLKSASLVGLKKSYTLAEAEELRSDSSSLSVKVGKTDVEAADYSLKFENCDKVGKGTIVIQPSDTGKYVGEKRVSITITGTKLGSVVLSPGVTYNGKIQEPDVKVYTEAKGMGDLIQESCYDVAYNVSPTNAATVTVTVTARAEEGYSGKLTAKYKISPRSINDGGITVSVPDKNYYSQGGTKPSPLVNYTNGESTWTLREGFDYTVSYSNNTVANGTKAPAFTITGKGNFTGKRAAQTYTISKRDISTLSMACADVVANGKKKGTYYNSKPVIYDVNGKALKENSDYTVTYTNLATGNSIGKQEIIPAGTSISAMVVAKEKNYTGSAEIIYKVVEQAKNISAAKVGKIANQYYTGKAIELASLPLTYVTGSGKTKVQTELEEGRDYVITSYYNNVNKGTASLRIEGRGEYTGSKIISYKIVAANTAASWLGTYINGKLVGCSAKSVTMKNEVVAPGEKVTMTPVYGPENCDIPEVTWKSSNTKVATVDKNGVVTGKGKGTATITVTSTSNTMVTTAATVTVD